MSGAPLARRAPDTATRALGGSGRRFASLAAPVPERNERAGSQLVRRRPVQEGQQLRCHHLGVELAPEAIAGGMPGAHPGVLVVHERDEHGCCFRGVVEVGIMSEGRCTPRAVARC
jgi:hypothetical protein